MIKRIETWLRRIFADEVTAPIKRIEDSLQRVETSFAAEREKYLAEIRDTITSDLKQFMADLIAEKLLRAEPQHWYATDDVKRNDQALRKAR